MANAESAAGACAMPAPGETAAWDALSAPPLPGDHASFHTVGHRGVLFDSARQRLYAINRSAGFIWCCLAEGYTSGQAVHALSQRTDTSVLYAEALVAEAIESWSAAGLLRDARRDFDGTRIAPIDHGTARSARVRRGRGGSVETVLHCGLLDSRFRLSVSDAAIATELAPVLAAFRASGPAAAAEELHVVRQADGRTAIRRGGTRWWAGPRAQLVPALHAILPRLALERSRSFPAIHAAAVLGPRGAVLFPGASGCGKSTLAAALMNRGHKVLCDDTVVLDADSGHIRPVGPYLCLKSGSWGLIGADGNLETRRSYRRPDGALVRFLPVTGEPDAGAESTAPLGFPVHAIVFPRYRPGSASRLMRLGTAAALHRLVRCLDPIGNRLDAEQVERIIRWVRRTDCHALTVDAIDTAVKMLSRVLR